MIEFSEYLEAVLKRAGVDAQTTDLDFVAALELRQPTAIKPRLKTEPALVHAVPRKRPR